MHTVFSTIPGGGYGQKNGTSMASPHVTGVAALVYSEFSYLTWQQVRSRILIAVATESALSGKVATGERLDAARPLGVWTQYGYSGTEWGTFSQPYNTLGEALPWVPVEGHLFIRPVTVLWTGTINKAMYVEAY